MILYISPLLSSYRIGDRPVLWTWQRMVKVTRPIWEERPTMRVRKLVEVQMLGVRFRISEDQWPKGEARQLLYCRLLLRKAGLDPDLFREMHRKVAEHLNG